jgi:hypothetical protein
VQRIASAPSMRVEDEAIGVAESLGHADLGLIAADRPGSAGAGAAGIAVVPAGTPVQIAITVSA